MADFKPGMGGNWLKVLEYYAEQTNVKMIKKKKRDIEPPSQAMVDRFIKKLTPDVRQYLRDKRGFTDETIEKFQIGWDPKRGRNSYPVFDKDGEVVNIRFHNSKKKPKTMSISGYGEARIYNAQALVEAKDNETIVITEGECYDPEIAHVLTPDGWVRLIDYCNQKVLQITPDGMSEFVQPIAYIIKPHKKALCTYACDDFFSATTRDHNMVLYNKLTSQFEKYRADDLPTKDDHFRLPNSTQLYGGPGLGKKTMAKIRLAMAIDIVGTKTFNKSTGIENVVFDFNDQYEDVEYRRYCVDRLDEILDGTKIETEDYVYENGRIKITFDLGDWYNEYRNFKFRWIPDASIAERRNLMNEMDFWHRQETPHTWRYEFNTDNYNNAVFVQTLAHTCGLMSEVMKVDNVNYYIVIFNSRRQTINANRVKKGYRHTKSGLVACVQVPSGMILTRQRETISIGGNCDAIIVSQETGLKAVSPTNGCATFMPGWVDEFKNKNVVLLYDADQQGRNAVKSLVLPMFKRAVLSGDVRSIKAMWLFENEDKSNKDATDWFVKAGGTKAQFMEQMAAAKNYVFKAPSLVLPKPINLKSFVDVENSDFVGKRISVPIYIYGENSETYHAVNEVKVTFCPKLESGGCVGRADWDWQCADPIMIQQGSRIQLACVQTSDAQVKNAMREYICDKGRNPSINIAEKNRTTIRELFAHQVFKERIGTETGELVEKTIYNIGNDVVPIGQYQATGFVHSNPKNQKPTMIIDGMTKQDEDWQAFNLEESRQYLRDIQPMDIMEIVDDLADNVTRIYSREDLHIGMLLTLCSPQWIDFPGDGRIRGWISSVTIGDSGTGKSFCAEKMLNHAGVGYRVSGMTASRTGITYAIDRDETHGWRIKAGAMLKMSRQALIVDEAQDLEEHDIKTMADAMDTGKLSIDRVENRTFEAMTRCLFLCNPKMMDRTANQRTMDSFRYGCQSLIDIFPQMMLRRIDLAMFAARFDIENKSKLYKRKESLTPSVISSKHMKALVHYAWNLQPENIIFDDNVADYVREKAFELSNEFGQCTDLPLVCPEDFRKTLARIATAFAIIDLSSDDDMQSITVTDRHVSYVADTFLKQSYSALNCRLNQYSNQYRSQNVLLSNEKEQMYLNFLAELNSREEGSAKRMLYMFREIAGMDINEKTKATQREFSEHLLCDMRTIRKDMAWFVKNNLIKSSRGYMPLNKCIIFYNYCLDEDAKKKTDSERLFI